MSFYNSAIAALFPLLLAISSPQPNISASATAQTTSPATTSQQSAIALDWDSARLVHNIPDSP